jgi:neurotransmitter:Na+ symporter, NSS family
MEIQREHWGSYWGFLFAAIGSAVGIGNIWRFPYLVGTYGGGAFLVPYLIVMISFGLGFMMLELALGRYYQTSIIGCLVKISQRFRWFGIFTVIVATSVLSYYLVILGWILSFLIIITLFPTITFIEYTNSLYPVASFFLILGVNYVIIRRGISGGIEKLNKFGVSILIALIVPLTIYGILLPNADKGIDYYLTPDLSRFSEAKLWTSVFGQVFFSLSIGFGTLIAYGSYIRRKFSLIKSSSIIILADATISIIAGLMIFSILFAFEMDPSQGVSLVFQVMPKVFLDMEFGLVIGVVFFALLLVAGLTSSIALFQVPVSALEDSLKFSRKKAAAISTGVIALVGTFSALSYSSYGFEIFNVKFLDFMDELFGTYGLLISAILFAIAVLWFMNKKDLIEQLSLHSPFRFPNWSITLMKFSLPLIIAISLAFHLLALFNFPN